MKTLLILLAGLIAGYFLYPVFHVQPKTIKLSYEEVGQFEEFVNKEARDFAVLEFAEKKVKATEAIYSKIRILFLAHLGLESNFLINLKNLHEGRGQYFEHGKLIGDVQLRKIDGF